MSRPLDDPPLLLTRQHQVAFAYRLFTGDEKWGPYTNINCWKFDLREDPRYCSIVRDETNPINYLCVPYSLTMWAIVDLHNILSYLFLSIFFIIIYPNHSSANHLHKPLSRLHSVFLCPFDMTCGCYIFQASFPPSEAKKIKVSVFDATYKCHICFHFL